MHRDPTTSQSIQERFPEEYARLHTQSDVVVSCAQQFSWAGGYGQLLGGAGLLQKLPFRTHVGIKKTNTGRMEYMDARVYTPLEQQFTELSLSHFIDTDITATLQEHILPLLPKEFSWSGCQIRILIEADWVDVVPCFTALAAALLLLSGSLTPDFFRQISRIPVRDLQKDPHRSKVILLWKVACLLENGYLYTPSLPEVLTCIIEARMPLLTQTNDTTHLLSEDGRFVVTQESLNNLEECGWYLYKYDEHFVRSHLMPLEWGLVASGSHHMPSLHFPYTKAMPRFGDMKALDVHMHSTVPHSDVPVHDAYWFRRKIQMLHFYTMAAVDTFGRSLTTYDAGPFLHALHAMHEVSGLLQHHRLDHVTAPGSAPFKEFLKKHLRGNYKYLITEKSMRGNAKIFFAAPRHVLSGHMKELATLYPDAGAAAFTYASWLDGFGNDGLHVEYTRPFLLPATDKARLALGTLPPDILVDCARKKIYLGGERTTSNDLRSQHFTVQLLHQLALAPGQRILFEDLPRLSYTDSSNELQQKVLQPLVRAVEKYTGRSLGCTFETLDNQLWIILDTTDITLKFTHETGHGLQCRRNAAVQQHLVSR